MLIGCALVSREVPDEELCTCVDFEGGDASVPTKVGVQCLLWGTKGIEQVERGLPVVAFVVPLQQHLQRDGQVASLVQSRPGHETSGEEVRGADSGLDHGKPDANGDDASFVTCRATDLGQWQEGVKD
jgi:hypothetical protein